MKTAAGEIATTPQSSDTQNREDRNRVLLGWPRSKKIQAPLLFPFRKRLWLAFTTRVSRGFVGSSRGESQPKPHTLRPKISFFFSHFARLWQPSLQLSILFYYSIPYGYACVCICVRVCCFFLAPGTHSQIFLFSLPFPSTKDEFILFFNYFSFDWFSVEFSTNATQTERRTMRCTRVE